MVNNSFTLMGVALTDFETINLCGYPVKRCKIETSRLGKLSGTTSTFNLIAYSNNKCVEQLKDIKGKYIMAEGFLDIDITDTDKVNIRLVVQDVFVIGHEPNKINFVAF